MAFAAQQVCKTWALCTRYAHVGERRHVGREEVGWYSATKLQRGVKEVRFYKWDAKEERRLNQVGGSVLYLTQTY